MFESPSPATSSLDVHRPLPRLCSFGQVHSNQNFRSLPQLDDVDDILQRGDGETDKSDKLWPGKVLQKWKRSRDGERNRRSYPVSEVEGDKEELISSTDKEERCLMSVGGEKWGSG